MWMALLKRSSHRWTSLASIFDEGAAIDGSNGDYGPYYQSQRGEIYQCYVKALVKKGQAYPCFLTEEEIAAIRQNQEQNKENPGIYGEYAPCRGLILEEIEQNINAGKPYVIRLKSDGHQDPQKARTISIEDGIRGILSMPENYQDVVILKATGIPTYHFAHVVDDHLMRYDPRGPGRRVDFLPAHSCGAI